MKFLNNSALFVCLLAAASVSFAAEASFKDITKQDDAVQTGGKFLGSSTDAPKSNDGSQVTLTPGNLSDEDLELGEPVIGAPSYASRFFTSLGNGVKGCGDTLVAGYDKTFGRVYNPKGHKVAKGLAFTTLTAAVIVATILVTKKLWEKYHPAPAESKDDEAAKVFCRAGGKK